ncbi:MAG: hypothetical protein ACXU95_18540 [Isosphaeraceae bacterium]
MTERARTLKVGGSLLGILILGLGLGFACSKRTVPPGTDGSPSPTSTDPKVHVEQAYLHAWDVWADALLRLDPSKLSSAMTGNALTRVTSQVETQRQKNQPVRIRVDHDYSITMVDATTYSVDDNYINHSVRLDPKTMQPIEKDPNQHVHESFTMKLVSGIWKLADVIEYKSSSPSP